MSARIIEHCRKCNKRRVMWGSHDGSLFCKDCFQNTEVVR